MITARNPITKISLQPASTEMSLIMVKQTPANLQLIHTVSKNSNTKITSIIRMQY